MARALSIDLRQRVVKLINSGVSRRQAAIHFGVSAASAVRWMSMAATSGDITAKKQGGDRRSGGIEAEAAFILAELNRKSDITLAELQAKLVARGKHFGIGTLWRFFDRRQITLKKRWHMQQSNSDPM